MKNLVDLADLAALADLADMCPTMCIPHPYTVLLLQSAQYLCADCNSQHTK